HREQTAVMHRNILPEAYGEKSLRHIQVRATGVIDRSPTRLECFPGSIIARLIKLVNGTLELNNPKLYAKCLCEAYSVEASAPQFRYVGSMGLTFFGFVTSKAMLYCT